MIRRKTKKKKEKKNKKNKNRKTSIVSNITVQSEDKKKSTKKDKKISSKVDEEESECEVKIEKLKKNKTRKASIKKETKEESDDDFDISPEAMKQKYNIQVSAEDVQRNNAPFKRIDESRYKVTDSRLNNNSYDHFANASGNTFANEANKKLKVTAGKDFRKEKTKFKNKSGFGGVVLSTSVQSIKLYDSDSD